MTKSILMIMNAREIPECIDAINSLNIDKVWFRGFTEYQLEYQINHFISISDYDKYILLSDDTIPTQKALDIILKYQELVDVVTGWCNLSPHIMRASLYLHKPTKKPHYIITQRVPQIIGRQIGKLISHGIFPFKQIYEKIVVDSFTPIEDIYKMPELFKTYFISWSLTSISRKLWLVYGFKYPEKYSMSTGSDMYMSNSMIRDNIEMYCARDAFIYHLHSKKNFLVGKVQPEVILEINNSRIKIPITKNI